MNEAKNRDPMKLFRIGLSKCRSSTRSYDQGASDEELAENLAGAMRAAPSQRAKIFLGPASIASFA